jgi:hypothetical protein
MKEENLPVLPFCILDPEKNLRTQIVSFLQEINQEKFCARIDNPNSKMGLKSIIDANLEDLTEIKEMAEKNTVFISHPGNVYRNYHSVNIMKDINEIIVEAIGQGFITPDMDKYGLVHERIVLDKNFNELSRDVIVDSEKYAKDVEGKIGNKIESHKQNNSLLIQVKKYIPLSEAQIKYIKIVFPKLERSANELGYDKFVASLSFIELDNKIEPIFWDIFGFKR